MNASSPKRSATPNLTDRAVPGRVAVGTVTRVGLVRQEPLMTRRTTVLAWAGATACALGVALAPFVGGVSLLAKALLVACGCGLAVFAVHRWGPRPRPVDVLPFWIKEVSGAEHTCLVRGRLPRTPEQGSSIEVYGRRAPSGDVLVRRLIDANGEVSRVRLPFGLAAARAASYVVIGCWAAGAVFLTWLLTFGR